MEIIEKTRMHEDKEKTLFQKRNVIIFHISEFGGHSKAAQNIRKALHYRNSHIKVLNLNGVRYFYPYCEKIIDVTYTTAIKHFPHLWGNIYDRKKIIRGLKPLRTWINKIAFKKLMHLLRYYDPSCIVTTQAFPCGLIADFKHYHKVDIPLIAVVTDYHPHRFWIHSKVDKYVVACHEAQEVLEREGVAQEKIKILGIPISVEFLQTYSREVISQELGLFPHFSSLLVMGGGLGMGPIKRVVQELDTLTEKFQMVVVCGKNERLYNWFEKKRKKFNKPVFPVGYVDCVHKLMDFSDIIITKAGGITVSEALAKGLTLIITNPILGQEERNVEYLLKKNAVIKSDDLSGMRGIIKDLFTNKQKLLSLKSRAKEISFIDSSLRIADLILKEIKNPIAKDIVDI